MQLSTKGRYAVMAMTDLAGRPVERATPLAAIAETQQISKPYLEQLFSRLRRRGLVASVRGPGGGFRVARGAPTPPPAAGGAPADGAPRPPRCHGLCPPYEPGAGRG